MAELELSSPIETPEGQRSKFTLADRATLGLFRGVKLPVRLEAGATELVLDGDQLTILVANLLQIPPSFAAKVPLDLMGEILGAARPLLPAWMQGLFVTGSGAQAS